MTGFAEIAISARQSFARHGVAVIDYDSNGLWRTILSAKIQELFVDPPLDFVIICALEKERAALTFCDDIVIGELTNVQGMDCQAISLGQLAGIAIVSPRPGLINAAIVSTRALETFRPRAIAMCGICAGVDGETTLGDLVVPDLSWNYQTGKIEAGKLKQELQQIPIPPTVKTQVKQMATTETSRVIRDKLLFDELQSREIKVQPMVSGSQVVADPEAGQAAVSGSRKVGALDMEVASVYAAAHEFYNGGGIFLAAKTVVDMGDKHKDDRYHQYGCAVSARFVAQALNQLL